MIKRTWRTIIFLALLTFFTFVIVLSSGLQKSIIDSSGVTDNLQFLLSFVLTGYLGLVVNRWDLMRRGTFGKFWTAGALLSMQASRFLGSSEEDLLIKNTVDRYICLTVKTTFLAAQRSDNLSSIADKNLANVSLCTFSNFDSHAHVCIPHLYICMPVSRKKKFPY